MVEPATTQQQQHLVKRRRSASPRLLKGEHLERHLPPHPEDQEEYHYVMAQLEVLTVGEKQPLSRCRSADASPEPERSCRRLSSLAVGRGGVAGRRRLGEMRRGTAEVEVDDSSGSPFLTPSTCSPLTPPHERPPARPRTRVWGSVPLDVTPNVRFDLNK